MTVTLQTRPTEAKRPDDAGAESESAYRPGESRSATWQKSTVSSIVQTCLHCAHPVNWYMLLAQKSAVASAAPSTNALALKLLVLHDGLYE